MGRIIIIGNGFDLAHGLKTSYADLMEYIKEKTNPHSQRVDHYRDGCGGIHHIFKGKENPYISFKYNSTKGDYIYSDCSKNNSIYFKSLFQNFNQNQKWSDLETLYFNLISTHQSSLQNIKLINKEFDYLKEILKDYLTNVIENKVGSYDFLRDNIFESRTPDTEKVLGIINFNFTNKLISNYIKDLWNKPKQIHNNFQLINVHGELNNSSNPIIFGYGDDNSEKYKTIQEREINELLVNFKTFQYLRNTNYKNVLGLLEIERGIKVEVIGHSCGISDKTLLKTIFEHSNVSSIEYRYHTEEKYYFENLYNMSRIFSETSLMRNKVIDLSITRKIPQPQIQLISDEVLLQNLK